MVAQPGNHECHDCKARVEPLNLFHNASELGQRFRGVQGNDLLFGRAFSFGFILSFLPLQIVVLCDAHDESVNDPFCFFPPIADI